MLPSPSCLPTSPSFLMISAFCALVFVLLVDMAHRGRWLDGDPPNVFPCGVHGHKKLRSCNARNPEDDAVAVTMGYLQATQ